MMRAGGEVAILRRFWDGPQYCWESGGSFVSGSSQVNARLQGVAAASAAYVMWGFMPLYWRLVSGADSWEVIAHRVMWSLVFFASHFGISLAPWGGASGTAILAHATAPHGWACRGGPFLRF